jgi:SHS family lactate transporter-like MFS transporter
VNGRAWRLLLLAGLAAFLGEFDGATLPLALPAISSEFRAPLPTLSNLGSLLLLGGLLALPMAVLADRRGRRRMVAIGVLGFSLADLASAFATGIPMLAACRFVAVAFEALVATLAPVLAVEEVPDQHRALGVAGLTFLAAAGGGLTTIVYPFLAPHWRLLYLSGAVGVPASALIWRALPETRTWIASHHTERPLSVLLQSPWRGRMVLLAAFSLLSVVFYEPSFFYGVLYGSRSLHLAPAPISAILIVSGWVGAAGFLAGGWLSDRYGRRRLGVAFLVASAVLSGLAYAGTLPAFAVGYVLGPLAGGLAGPMTAAWFSELFPTRARATSQSIALGAGTIGGVIGLQAVAAVAPAVGLGPALLGCALGLVAGALLLLRFPETRGQPLPE